MEMEEIVKILIAVIVLVLLVGVFILFTDKGGGLIGSVKDFLRFGG